jgi:hypothetical protein
VRCPFGLVGAERGTAIYRPYVEPGLETVWRAPTRRSGTVRPLLKPSGLGHRFGLAWRRATWSVPTRVETPCARPTRDQRRHRISGRVSPPNAEGMPCRVGIHLMALLSIEVPRLEQSCAKPYRRYVCNSRIFDVEVEMHLLGSTVRPLRRDVIGRELHADGPLAGRSDDAHN